MAVAVSYLSSWTSFPSLQELLFTSSCSLGLPTNPFHEGRGVASNKLCIDFKINSLPPRYLNLIQKSLHHGDADLFPHESKMSTRCKRIEILSAVIRFFSPSPSFFQMKMNVSLLLHLCKQPSTSCNRIDLLEAREREPSLIISGRW